MTREIIASMEVSLDGFVARTDGTTDWITDHPDTFDWELFDHADTCVLGRVMYPGYESYWRSVLTDPNASPVDRRYAEYASRTTHYILSATTREFDWDVASSIYSLDAVAALRHQDGGTIFVAGGGKTVTAFLTAGLLDELRLNIHPVLLGDGIPLFGTGIDEQRLAFASATTLSAGMVRLVYRPSR